MLHRFGKTLQFAQAVELAEDTGTKSLLGNTVGNEGNEVYVKVSSLPKEV